MKYAPFGMHHGDAGYDTNDAELTERQRAILEFPRQWFNEPPQLERPASFLRKDRASSPPL